MRNIVYGNHGFPYVYILIIAFLYMGVKAGRKLIFAEISL